MQRQVDQGADKQPLTEASATQQRIPADSATQRNLRPQKLHSRTIGQITDISQSRQRHGIERVTHRLVNVAGEAGVLPSQTELPTNPAMATHPPSHPRVAMLT